jgi:proteasome assembly chaperone (PAC2) family protein
MSALEKEEMKVEKDLFEIYQIPPLRNPSLIIGWQTPELGNLGAKVIHFLIEKLEGKEIAEMKPLGFFSFGGARFKNDLVQVPESKFWACEKHNLLMFKSDEPEFDHYRFLNSLLDFAKEGCQTKEMYTVNETISIIAHTQPRRILTVFNRSEFKEKLQSFGLKNMTWEGPPALSSYLLWVAKRRGIPGVSLWSEMPFYIAPGKDPQGMKIILSFLNRKFDLGLDIEELDHRIRDQNEKIAQLRKENGEIDQSITRLENGETLDEEEQIKLSQEVFALLEES